MNNNGNNTNDNITDDRYLNQAIAQFGTDISGQRTGKDDCQNYGFQRQANGARPLPKAAAILLRRRCQG